MKEPLAARHDAPPVGGGKAANLVYIANSIIPSRTANSIHVMKMCAAFGRHCASVRLIIPGRSERSTGIADPFAYYGVEPTFTIDELPWGRLPGRAYAFAWRGAQRAHDLRPDLVYGRMVQACYFSVLRAIPTIFESHAPISDFGITGTWMFSRMIRHRAFRGLVVISHALRNHYEQTYTDLVGKVRTAADAADAPPPDLIVPRSAGARLSVGYVGHLYAGRGIELIVELARRCPWADFNLIGGASGDIEHWRQRCKGWPNVTFQGFCPPAEVRARTAAFDVLVAPYQHAVTVHGGKHDTSRWMSPLKIFEYMASAKPIVASDLPVLREVLDESNAVLVDPQDVDGWMRALQSLTDEQRRVRLGQKAYADFLARHTWERRAAQVIA